jgi:hypothetical protein
MALDYAPLFHHDPNDLGLTATFRFTRSDPKAPNAYHFVQPTLQIDGKRGVVFVEGMGSLTVFRAKDFLHTSTVNEGQPDRDWPALSVAVLQKSKTLNAAKRRADVLENMVDMDILLKYHRQQ